LEPTESNHVSKAVDALVSLSENTHLEKDAHRFRREALTCAERALEHVCYRSFSLAGYWLTISGQKEKQKKCLKLDLPRLLFVFDR
jgi:hypothetical protein